MRVGKREDRACGARVRAHAERMQRLIETGMPREEASRRAYEEITGLAPKPTIYYEVFVEPITCDGCSKVFQVVKVLWENGESIHREMQRGFSSYDEAFEYAQESEYHCESKGYKPLAGDHKCQREE